MGDTYTSWKPRKDKPDIGPRARLWGQRTMLAQTIASRAVQTGVIEGPSLQDAILGKKVGIPHGSASSASIFFHGPPDQSVQDPMGTGIFQSLADTLGISAAGAAQLVVDVAKVLFTNDIWFKSGTAFNGKMEHNITADRTWTYPDASGTLALTTGTTPVERKESHISLFLEDPEHTC